MRFRFRLQSLLDRAEHKEKAAARALAVAIAERTREADQLRKHTVRSDELKAAPLAAGLHMEALARLRASRTERIAQAETEIVRLRAELAVASRERRALDLLRERRHAQFELARERAEERELDDLNAAALSAHQGNSFSIATTSTKRPSSFP